MRVALKQFPGNSMIYTMLVAVAQRSTGERQKELATEIINAPSAPPGAKTLASHILKGTKPYRDRQALDIRFTALDGREVDLAKLKGKVVLVEFWSTACGPCIAEMPAVKAAYEKLHDHGFEVVAISPDDKETALRRFIKEHELPWPQHFDGKGWENQFAVRYGVFSLPTMWLVDKRGNLRDTNARLILSGASVRCSIIRRPLRPDELGRFCALLAEHRLSERRLASSVVRATAGCPVPPGRAAQTFARLRRQFRTDSQTPVSKLRDMKRTLIAIAVLTLMTVAGAWFMTSFGSSNRQPGRGDLDKLIAAAKTYADGLRGQGLPVPASVSMKELINRGLLTETDVSRLFHGLEVAVSLFANEPGPQDVLIRARLPDGHEWSSWRTAAFRI